VQCSATSDAVGNYQAAITGTSTNHSGSSTVTWANDANAFGNHYHGQTSLTTTYISVGNDPLPAASTTEAVIDATYYIENGNIPECPWSLNVQINKVCPTDGIAHSIKVTDGVHTFGPNNVPPDATSIVGQFSESAKKGSPVRLFVDGAQAGSWTVGDCNADPPAGNFFNHSGTIGAACPATPTPTPTPTPPGTPTPTPPATPTPAPTSTPVPNPSTPPTNTNPAPPPPYNGGSGNPQSSPLNVYEDVRRALNDSGNSDSASNQANGDFEVGEPDAKQQPALDILESSKQKLVEDTQKLQGAHDGVKVAYAADKKPIMPTGIGSTLSFAVTLPKLGAMVIDLNPYATYIEWIRNACLLVLYIMFWTWTSSTVRQAVS
jgi:hypothetical protein